MSINGDRSLLEQQILSNSGLQGSDLEALKVRLAALSEQELQREYEQLQSRLNKNANWGNVTDSFETGVVNPLEIIDTPQNPIKTILPKPTPEMAIPELTEEQAQEIAMQNLAAINSELDYALREEKPDDRDYDAAAMIYAESEGLEFLNKARSPQGLTVKEYLEGSRATLRTMLMMLYPQLQDKQGNLDERINSLNIEQIKDFQKNIINASLGNMDRKEVLRDFVFRTQTTTLNMNNNSDFTRAQSSTTVNKPYEPKDGEKLINFEQVYRIERGVEFNPENIRQYLIDGSETFFNDPLEDGFSNTTLDDLNKHLEYVQRMPKSYIQAFGQPYRAEYLSVLESSDYDTSSAYGLNRVRLSQSDLTPSTGGIEYVIPSRDITQGTNTRELDEKELKRFSVNMLYNILNTTYNMFKGYYDGAWEQLKTGSVGTAAVQGFLGFGEMLSGQDLTAHSQMDKVGALLAKAIQLKNMNDNDFEKHFDEMFSEICGKNFDIDSMQNFAQLTMKGLKTDTDEYDAAVKRAFGSNRTGDAETQFSILNPINSVVDIVAFLAGSEVIGGTKLFAQIGSKSLQLTAKGAARLGFNPASKTVQAGIRLVSSSPVSALNMMTYTGITEIGGTTLYNAAEKMDVIKPQHGEYMSVLDKVDKSLLDDDMIRILVDITKQGAMGSVAPFIGAFANKTGKSLASVFSKGNPSAIQRSFSTLTKAENKTLNAQSLMKDYLSALEMPTFTKAQQVISTSSSFLTEVAGFTGYSTLEHIAEGLLTGELDLENIDLGEEFKGQLQGLATLKGVARFIQMKKSGAVARGVQDKNLGELTEHLKNYEITDVGGKYRVLDKTNGKFETFNNPEDAVNHLFMQMFIESAAAKYEKELTMSGAENDPSLENPVGSSEGERYSEAEVITDKAENETADVPESKKIYTLEDVDRMKSSGEPVAVKDGIVYKFDPVSKKNVEIGEISETVPVESAPSPQVITEGVRERLKSFGMEKVFTEDELLTDGKDISKQVGVDKDGKPVYELTEEGEELVWRAAKQIRKAALANEPNIIEFMRELGLASDKSIFKDEDGNMIDIAHRSKSEQSLHDKIRTAILKGVKKNKNINLAQAITGVNDGIGCRTANIVANYTNEPDVKAALDNNDMKTAIMLAVEHESAAVYDALIKYIDSVAAGTNKVKLIRIANYIGEDGIPYFTERQLNRLEAYAASKNIRIPFIERVYTLAERQAVTQNDDVYNSEATTQTRGSGYTALQMNFVDKETGFVYEWQYRGEKVNEFAEGEHVPYDLRTGKDIIGKNTELKGLYEPMKKILSKEKMSPEEYTEYENYLTAFYEYLRLNELGFNDGTNPPKLPAKFDARLRAENLMLLHEYSDKVKKSPANAEQLTKEYESRLIQNTPDNTTTESYTQKAAERSDNRVIDRYEASRRIGENNGLTSDKKYSSIVIKACRDNGTGQIRENLIKEVEQLQILGVEDRIVAQIITKMKNGNITSIDREIKHFKKNNPEFTENEIAGFLAIALTEEGKIDILKLHNAASFYKEAPVDFDVLSHIYEKMSKVDRLEANNIRGATRLLCQTFNASKLGEMKNSDSLMSIFDACFDKDGKMDNNAFETAIGLLKCNVDFSDIPAVLAYAKNSNDGKIYGVKNVILGIINKTQNFTSSGYPRAKSNSFILKEILKSLRKAHGKPAVWMPSDDNVNMFNYIVNQLQNPNATGFQKMYQASQIILGAKGNYGIVSKEYVDVALKLVHQKYTLSSVKELIHMHASGETILRKLDCINNNLPIDPTIIKYIDVVVEDGLIRHTVAYKDGTIHVRDFDMKTLEKKGDYKPTTQRNTRVGGSTVNELDDSVRGMRTRVKKKGYKAYEATVVVKDPVTGETIGIEYQRESEDVKGGLDIQYRDTKNGGTTKTLSETRRDEFGNVLVRKDYDSLDGTNTKFDYKESPDGSYSSTYKITDAEGNVRLNEHRTFTVLDATRCESTCNGKKYLIEITEDNLLTVTKETGEKVSFDLDEFSDMNMNNADFVELFKHIPGHEFFQMKKVNTSRVKNANVEDNAHYLPTDNSINLGVRRKKLSTFLHEFGHNKDHRLYEDPVDKTKYKLVVFDEEIVQQYEEERKAFVQAFPNLQRDFVDYFVSLEKVGERVNRGLSEVIAETNKLLNQSDRDHSFRGEYLRRYFPKTISLVAKKLNPEIYTN